MDRFPVTRLVVAMLVALAALAIPAGAVAADVVDQANVPASLGGRDRLVRGRPDVHGRQEREADVRGCLDRKRQRLCAADEGRDPGTDGNGIPTSTEVASATTTITAATAGGNFKFAPSPVGHCRRAVRPRPHHRQPRLAESWFDWWSGGDAYTGGSVWTFTTAAGGPRRRATTSCSARYVDTTPDTTKPVTNFAVTGTAGNRGWLRGTPTLSATATDPDSGVAETRCWIKPSAPPAYTTAGSQACSGPVPDGPTRSMPRARIAGATWRRRRGGRS